MFEYISELIYFYYGKMNWNEPTYEEDKHKSLAHSWILFPEGTMYK